MLFLLGIKRVIGLIVLVVLVGIFGYFWSEYHSPLWWWAPSKLPSVQGHSYHSDKHTIDASDAKSAGVGTFHKIGNLPLGQGIYAKTVAGLTPSIVYVKEWTGKYEVYTLTR